MPREPVPEAKPRPRPPLPAQKVERAAVLADVLHGLYPDSSGRRRKQLLEAGRVRVNGAVVKVPKTELKPGDLVTIGPAILSAELPPELQVVHEDEDVIVVEKGPGLLTIATATERERTAYAWLSAHVKRSDRRGKVFIVHRLDRLASGLLVFAKSPEVKRSLMEQFRTHEVGRLYLAVVDGVPAEPAGVVEAPLVEDSTGRVHVGRGPDRREARTHWRVLRRGPHRALLEVRLETGRKHQIRVHLASIGHPIAGDEVYGRAAGPGERMALHAHTLAFDHPRTRERMEFTSPLPRALRKLVP